MMLSTSPISMWQSHFRTLPGTSPKAATMPTNVSTSWTGWTSKPSNLESWLGSLLAAKMLAQTGTTTAKPTCPTWVRSEMLLKWGLNPMTLHIWKEWTSVNPSYLGTWVPVWTAPYPVFGLTTAPLDALVYFNLLPQMGIHTNQLKFNLLVAEYLRLAMVYKNLHLGSFSDKYK